MTSGTQWSMRGDYFENCNCDVICACSSTKGQIRPDKGNCDVVLAFEVAEGSHGGVSLNGAQLHPGAHDSRDHERG